jgi:hypothetical protein
MPNYLTTFSQGFAPGDILACDPVGLVTKAIPIARGQGWLPRGTFIDYARDPATPGTRSTAIGANTFGILAHGIATDQDSDTAATCFLSGAFILPRIVEVNPDIDLNQAAHETLRAKNITLENANY